MVKKVKRPKLQARPTSEAGTGVGVGRRLLMRWLDLLGRMFAPGRQRKQAPPPVVVAPVKPPAGDRRLPADLMREFDELVPRLVVHEAAEKAVRHLLAVYNRLRAGGWPEVERLKPRAISRAIGEAELIAADEPAAVLQVVIVRLRVLEVAAKERARQRAQAQCEAFDREYEQQKPPEVSDTNFDEYELMERSWAGTVPAGLVVPARAG